MSIQEILQARLHEAFLPLHLAIVDESHRHAMQAQDSHFHITVVSHGFRGLSLLGRHRAVYAVLAQELAGPVHALTLHTFTPEEWEARGQRATPSPACRGG